MHVALRSGVEELSENIHGVYVLWHRCTTWKELAAVAVLLRYCAGVASHCASSLLGNALVG